jgi:hypothetical protein
MTPTFPLPSDASPLSSDITEKELLKLDAEIAGTDTLALGLAPAPVEDELLEHAATTRAALAATDVKTILLAACCMKPPRCFAGRTRSASFVDLATQAPQRLPFKMDCRGLGINAAVNIWPDP